MNTRVTVYENATPRDKRVFYTVDDGDVVQKTILAGQSLKLPRGKDFHFVSSETVE